MYIQANNIKSLRSFSGYTGAIAIDLNRAEALANIPHSLHMRRPLRLLKRPLHHMESNNKNTALSTPILACHSADCMHAFIQAILRAFGVVDGVTTCLASVMPPAAATGTAGLMSSFLQTSLT